MLGYRLACFPHGPHGPGSHPIAPPKKQNCNRAIQGQALLYRQQWLSDVHCAMFWTWESHDPLFAWENRLYLPQQELAVVSVLSFYFCSRHGSEE